MRVYLSGPMTGYPDPDWQASRGAALEVHVAQQLGVPVVPVDVLLAQPVTTKAEAAS